MTFSIVGRSTEPDGSLAWGVAVASKFLAVGNAVPAAAAGVGAVATQADTNTSWKYAGLGLLDDGATAQVALDRLFADDDRPAHRQAGIVGAAGDAATRTGEECLDWAGGIAEEEVAIQGNILVGPQVVEAMHRAWRASAGRPLAHRLLEALEAGDDAGGDRRGRQAAALLVVSEAGGYGQDDLAADLRVDDHSRPVRELRRLLDLNDFYLCAPPEHDRVPVTATERDILEAAAHAAGHPSVGVWIGTQNYEMRAAEDLSWVDRQVLDIARRAVG